jgi:pyruvate/2-oxoglutarate dehydrogenase complex dihydrolipoamide acyltransferase (E2) component
MILRLQMPKFGEEMRDGTIHRLLASPGARLDRGTPLLEVRVDLSAIAEQNCSPISIFRVVAAESGWLRTVQVTEGDRRSVGGTLATIAERPDDQQELDEGEVPTRPLRVSVATVLSGRHENSSGIGAK